MSNNNNGDGVLVAILIATSIVAIGIWKFSQAVGLDFPTSADVILRLVSVIAAWVAICYFTPISFKDSWPVALAAIWFCWWPALNYWSDKSSPVDFVQYGVIEPMWYATWYTKGGIFAGIVAAGYSVQNWLDE